MPPELIPRPKCIIEDTILAIWPYLFIQLCFLNIILDLKIFPQTLQGSETPSKWFASMWSLMPMLCPSFPHTLQILALPGPFGRRFWLVSIIDFTFSSSSCKSPDTKLGIAILRSLFGLCLSRLKSTTNVLIAHPPHLYPLSYIKSPLQISW